MFRKCKFFVNKTLVILLMLLFAMQQNLCAYVATDFMWMPPFTATDEKPSITIILDNSGSMLERAYTTAFNSTKEYYGYFDPRSYYRYATNRFVSDNSSNGKWNGNWLNWATMLRVDVARKVLGGGKYSSGIYSVEMTDWSGRVSEFTYNDKYPVLDLNGNSKYMTPIKNNIANLDHAYQYTNSLYCDGSYYRMDVEGPFCEGVLHKFKDKARMALFIYHVDHGGLIQNYMTDNATKIDQLINNVNTIRPSTWTPLAETLYTVYGYIRQNNANVYNGTAYVGPRYQDNSSYRVATSATKRTYSDPFYFEKYDGKIINGRVHNGLVECTKQSVILVTDGESTEDQNVPRPPVGSVNPKPHSYPTGSNGSPHLIDVAHWGQTTDMRTDLNGTQTVDFYTVYAFGSKSWLLKDAAWYGKSLEGDGKTVRQWNVYPASAPDNYFEAESGQDLETAIFKVFQQATSGGASGTAAAVTQPSREGEGAAYQALFFPPTSATKVASDWSGQVHAFLLDAHGNLREDTDGDRVLDLTGDKVVRFEEDPVTKAIRIYTDTDSNGDCVINATEKSTTSLLSINNLKFLWSSSDWLNGLTATQASQQRVYSSTTSNRYIFTFADKDQKGVPKSGDIQDFVSTTSPLSDGPNYFYNYLTLYEGASGVVAARPASVLTTNWSNYVANATKRQIDFIRGVEVGNATLYGVPDIVRSRSQNGTTWRLGDIIFSSPTLVAKPAENYHRLYKDKTYEAFVQKYRNRRQMVYVGANDGMLHAFNAGFYNSTSVNATRRGRVQTSWTGTETAYPLGMELWAYVPYNLLPHLKWLMSPGYGGELHAAYMDLTPRVFDARIFFNSDGVTPMDNSTYPYGWGTVLVAGMRLGGANIGIDVDKDGTADRNATSAYVIMDVTDPEQPPKLLGEMGVPGMGFTTCVPGVIPMTNATVTTGAENEWYLVFGSGPASATGIATTDKLSAETSNQAGRLFVLDLKALVKDKKLRTLRASDKTFTDDFHLHAFNTEPASFISEPIAVDLGIGSSNSSDAFKTDVVYFGTVAGDQVNGRGQMHRIAIKNNMNPATWTNSTLINVGHPIVAAPAVAEDEAKRLWVYFGTGRYFSKGDIQQNSRQSFFGVKEPVSGNVKTWDTVNSADLYNSTQITVTSNATCVAGNGYTKGCAKITRTVGGTNSTLTWDNLEAAVNAKAGWRHDFSVSYERALTEPSVYGGAVLFTSYTPSDAVCAFGGSSNLYALYYKTGTAYYKPILNTIGNLHPVSVSLGQGMAGSPSVHSGDGDSVTVQTSSGGIFTIPIDPPLPTRSGPISWQKLLN